MAKGKRFVGLVLTEQQARALLVYARAMHEHGAGRRVQRDMYAIRAKLDRALARLDSTPASTGARNK